MAIEKIGDIQMKKFFFKINGGIKNEVEILDERELLFKGKKYEYDTNYLSDNIMVLRINGNNYIAKAEKETDTDNTAFNIDIGSQTYNVMCKSELDILTEKFSKGKRGNRFKYDVVSPMPGAIVKLNVKEGDKVNKGDVLLVLEAMKMENEIKSTCNCTVVKMFVEEKNSVDKGQLLLKLDPTE